MTNAEDRIERARLLYERSVFAADATAPDTADRTLDAVDADVALARGRIAHARFLEHLIDGAEPAIDESDELAYFEHARSLYQKVDNVAGQAEAMFWIGTFHQVVHGDMDSALPHLERSLELATKVDDKLTMSYALRHLGIADRLAGRLASAREQLEASTQLRRDLGFQPGVAANLIDLAHVAAGEGDGDAAQTLLREAATLARDSGAARILRIADAAREEIGDREPGDQT